VGNTSFTPGRAGEGQAALPKGLSLFRFILFSALMLGALYGGCGLYFNQPPPPGDIAPDGSSAAQWQPSVLWLPSWLLLHAGVFAGRGADGYRFSSPLGLAAYSSLNVMLGIVLVGAAGWIVGERTRQWWIRHR
jgi:hypothetical protein